MSTSAPMVDQRNAASVLDQLRAKAPGYLPGFAPYPGGAGDALFQVLAEFAGLVIERLNEEFRRRTKTQGMFPNESSILILMFGIIASGMVKLRRIPGYQTLGDRPQEIKHGVQALAV